MTKNIYSEENSEYLRNNPDWHVEDSPWKAKQILKMLVRNSLHPKSIAEVGCGAGEILNQLYYSLPDDIRFAGYDISIDAINLARQRTKDRLDFRNEDFTITGDNFDLLLMIDVFEHVEDYMGFLRSCKERKTKYVMFHIPLDIAVDAVLRNKLMAGRKYVGHLHYFTKETALATLKDCEYEIIDFFYTAGTLELPRFKSLIFLPARIMYKINKDLGVKLFSGFSLMVLAK